MTLTLGTRLRFYDCFIQTSVKKCTKRFCGEVLIRDWDGTCTIDAAKKEGYNKNPHPVAIYGTDFILVDKDQSQTTVNSYDRIKEINRFIAYTPSQQEIGDTQDRILKQQASFEEKQQLHWSGRELAIAIWAANPNAICPL